MSLKDLMQALLSADNNIRNDAEKALEEGKKSPQLLAGLCELMQSAEGAERQMAASCLKSAVTDANTWDALPDDAKKGMQPVLLQLLMIVTEKAARRSIEMTVSTIGCRQLEKNGWPDLLPALFQAAAQGDENQQISAMNILKSMAASLDGYKNQIGEALLACFNSPSLPVRLAATEGFTTFVSTFDDPACYKSLVLQILNTLAACDKEESVGDILMSLTELIEADSEFMISSTQMLPLLEYCYTVIANDKVGEPVRQRAAELVLTFIDTEPKYVKKQAPAFLDKLITLMLSCMQTVTDDDPEWGVTPEDEEDDEYTMAELGASALDRIAQAIGGTMMEKFTGAKILGLLNDENKADWRNRHAALDALSNIAEGCKKKFEVNLGNLTHLILSHFTDERAKVRYAAARAIAQFCTDFSPEFQGTFSDSVLSGLHSLISDPVARVRHISTSALVNFCEEAEPKLYENKIEGLLQQLYKLLDDPSEKLFVKEESLTAIASIAENVGSRFIPFYDTMMNVVMVVLSLPEVPEHRKIKAKALECSSFIAVACGTEKVFAGGANSHGVKVLDYLRGLTLSSLEKEDTRSKYIVQVWMRFVQVSKQHFYPYLPSLVEKLCGQMLAATDLESCDDDDNKYKNDDDVETFTLGIKGEGERKFAVHTGVVDEKRLILEIFAVFFEHVDAELLLPYIEKLVAAFLPEVSHFCSEEVRECAAQLCPLALKCIKTKIDKGTLAPAALTAPAQQFIPVLAKAIRNETDIPTASSIVKCLTDTFGVCGSNADVISAEELRELLRTIDVMFKESLTSCAGIMSQHNNNDDEEEKEKLEDEQDSHEELLIQCSELLGKLMQTQQQQFIAPFIEHLLPQVEQMCSVEKYGHVGVRLAICVFDDFMEHGQQFAVKYYHAIVEKLFRFASLHPDCGQCCSYGLNVAIKFGASIQNMPGGPGLPPNFVPRTLALLKEMMAKKKDEEWEAAACNAVSAMLTLVEHFSGQPGVSEGELLPLVCQQLPCGGDELEARVVHEKIFNYVRAGNENVVGAGKCNMEAIKTIASALMTEHTEDPEESRLSPATAALILELFK